MASAAPSGSTRRSWPERSPSARGSRRESGAAPCPPGRRAAPDAPRRAPGRPGSPRPRRGCGASRRAPCGEPWPGTIVSAVSTSGASAGQRRAVVVHRPARRDHRDLHVGEVVAGHQDARARGANTAHAVGGVALGRVQLQLAVAHVEPAGHRQRLDGAQASAARAGSRSTRRRCRAARAGRAGLGAQAQRGLLAHAQRQLREGEPAQQVIEVGVGGEQRRPARSPAWPSSAGSASSSSGK